MKHKFLPNVKIMAALVAGLLLSVAMMQDVNAETFGDYTYTLINGDEIEITGYPRDAKGAVEIPSVIDGKSVTSIGGSAFRDCSKLTSITIPNSVTIIGDSAFRNCASLSNLPILKSVTSIGESAFRNCGNGEKQKPSDAAVILEVVEMSSADYTNWIRDNDVGEIRSAAMGWIDSGDAKVVEALTAVIRSGQAVKAESILEYHYLGEHDHEDQTAEEGDRDIASGSTNPKTNGVEKHHWGVNVRNIGITFEASAVISDDRKQAGLNVALEMVTVLGDPLEYEITTDGETRKLTQPHFATYRSGGNRVVNDGEFAFFGTSRGGELDKMTSSSILLIFVRCDIIERE